MWQRARSETCLCCGYDNFRCEGQGLWPNLQMRQVELQTWDPPLKGYEELSDTKSHRCPHLSHLPTGQTSHRDTNYCSSQRKGNFIEAPGPRGLGRRPPCGQRRSRRRSFT